MQKFDTSSRKERKIIKNKIFDEKQEKYQESKWKYKLAFFSATGLEVNHRKSRIAISFQEFAVKIVSSKGNSWYFSFHEYSVTYENVNHHKLIIHLNITLQ